MINFFACLPGNFFRNSYILCKRSITINPQYLYIPADMRLPGTALVTLTAGNMRLGRHKVSGNQGTYFAANFHDLSGKLVAKDARNTHAALRPPIPLVDMHVCTTNGSRFHLYEYITRTNTRNINQGNRCSRRRLSFEDRLHLSFHNLTTPPRRHSFFYYAFSQE